MSETERKSSPELQDLVQRLDACLTGKPADAARNAAQVAARFSDPVAFALAGEYYLADGGYSRVVYSVLSGRLFLTSNSREAVKARWDHPEAAEARRRIEEILREAMGEA